MSLFFYEIFPLPSVRQKGGCRAQKKLICGLAYGNIAARTAKTSAE